jgi:hypothetical protein
MKRHAFVGPHDLCLDCSTGRNQHPPDPPERGAVDEYGFPTQCSECGQRPSIWSADGHEVTIPCTELAKLAAAEAQRARLERVIRESQSDICRRLCHIGSDPELGRLHSVPCLGLSEALAPPSAAPSPQNPQAGVDR